MSKIFKVGLIGCGHISETYFRAQEYFNNIRIVKCADINMDAAKKCAIHYNIEAVTVDELLKDKVTILFLASFGVVFSTFAVGSGLFWLIEQPVFGLNELGLTYVDCLLFGSLIAPTDPIAVLSIVKKMNLSPVTETRIAGESLFNDGIGVVIFLTLLKVKMMGVENVTPEGVSMLLSLIHI